MCVFLCKRRDSIQLKEKIQKLSRAHNKWCERAAFRFIHMVVHIFSVKPIITILDLQSCICNIKQ